VAENFCKPLFIGSIPIAASKSTVYGQQVWLPVFVSFRRANFWGKRSGKKVLEDQNEACILLLINQIEG
jgi:hypothetical protein